MDTVPRPTPDKLNNRTTGVIHARSEAGRSSWRAPVGTISGSPQNILRQAARLFAEQGYAGTTIIDLADACDSSRGALYHYFESKEDILFHILDGHVKDLLDRVEAAAGKVAEPLDQLRAIIAAIVLTNADSVHEQVVLLNHLKQLNVDQQKGDRGQGERDDRTRDPYLRDHHDPELLPHV